jgi:DNA-binding PadR family transcriptional regulator
MINKLEELILFIVLRGRGEATAGDVQEKLTEAAKKEQSFGAVFTALDRMSAKKLVKWKKGDPDKRPGGRAPRLYEITAAGRRALDESIRATEVAAGGLRSPGAAEEVSL